MKVVLFFLLIGQKKSYYVLLRFRVVKTVLNAYL